VHESAQQPIVLVTHDIDEALLLSADRDLLSSPSPEPTATQGS
jgi:ABC-type nitrate/sulfonate/bicarbonate transport system ATPase subunit